MHSIPFHPFNAMKTKSLNEFLSSLELPNFLVDSFTARSVPCELCKSDDLFRLRDVSDAGGGVLVEMPIVACNKCGYVQQMLKFDESFYDIFYSKLYRFQQAKSAKNLSLPIVNETGQKLDYAVANASKRAKNLFDYIAKLFPQFFRKETSVLDIGCGSGGFLDYFRSKGFEVYGNDPDESSIELARTLDLNVDCISAEDMAVDRKFDLIIIIGSLEHCKDPHKTLANCRECLNNNGLIVVEGRYFPISMSTSYLNVNHHRFLRSRQLQLLLTMNGFSPLISTVYPVCGLDVGREGSGWCFAKRSEDYPKASPQELVHLLSLYESPLELKKKLDEHDQSLLKGTSINLI